MKIILKKEVNNLGEAGDVVEVRSGYAQNYLIPQGFATVATPSAIKQLEETRRQRAHKEAKLVADAEALAAKIAETPVKVAVKVSESGKIYGSVTSAQVAVGEYEATVKCYKAVKAAVKVIVEAEA